MNTVYLRPTFWNWVRSEAAVISADGCSGPAAGFHIECCYEHDLGYFYAKDPRDAYLKFRGGAVDPWADAKPVSRRDVDARFRRCLQQRSTAGKYSPLSWWRWVGVRMGGRKSWAKHRTREADTIVETSRTEHPGPDRKD
jgi:hypothetical protein